VRKFRRVGSIKMSVNLNKSNEMKGTAQPSTRGFPEWILLESGVSLGQSIHGEKHWRQAIL